jgi:hypothetical protein
VHRPMNLRPQSPTLALLAGCALLGACSDPVMPTPPARPTEMPAWPDAPSTAATATPAPTQLAIPDLDGAWESRGLFPVRDVSLWSLQKMACDGEGDVWRCTIEAELHTRDRIRKVGQVSMRRTTTFRDGKACFAYEGVTYTLEDWLAELPLHGKLVDLFERDGLTREGCAEVTTLLPDHIGFRRGVVTWDERRPR